MPVWSPRKLRAKKTKKLKCSSSHFNPTETKNSNPPCSKKFRIFNSFQRSLSNQKNPQRTTFRENWTKKKKRQDEKASSQSKLTTIKRLNLQIDNSMNPRRLFWIWPNRPTNLTAQMHKNSLLLSLANSWWDLLESVIEFYLNVFLFEFSKPPLIKILGGFVSMDFLGRIVWITKQKLQQRQKPPWPSNK